VPLLLAAAAQDERLKLVELSYNHGKQGALTAGIAHASGDLLLMMDPDLQDPPDEIPRFVAAIDRGFDLVFGVRAEKRDHWLNVWFSRLFWWLLRRFTGLPLPRNLAVMRIFNRAFADRFLRYREQNRFIEGLFVHVGLRQSTLTIQQRARFAGVSKFTFGRKLDLAFTAILDFSDLPLRLTMRVGLSMVFVAALAALALVIVKLLNYTLLVGWPSVMVALCGGFGLQIFFLGVVGHYVGRLYREAKHRPLFSVKARTNLAPREGQDG
jgi:polyisoprenyl-phosphate glycosyltransferase